MKNNYFILFSIYLGILLKLKLFIIFCSINIEKIPQNYLEHFFLIIYNHFYNRFIIFSISFRI